MTTTNLTDDIVARAFEAGLRERLKWRKNPWGWNDLMLGDLRFGRVFRLAPDKNIWIVHFYQSARDGIIPDATMHDTERAAKTALVNAAVAAIMGGGE